MKSTLHREENKIDTFFSEFSTEDNQTSPWTTPFFPPQSIPNGPATTRFAQLLLDPITGAVTATEVVQRSRPNFSFDDDWYLEKDEAAMLPRKQYLYGEIIIPALEFSSCSSSTTNSSISSCTMSEQSDDEDWEDLFDTADAITAFESSHNPMPFVLSTVPLSSESFDDDSWMGHYLLSDDVHNEAIYETNQKKRGCISTLHLVRWRSVFVAIMEGLDQEEDALWYILYKCSLVRCYGPVSNSNRFTSSYESV